MGKLTLEDINRSRQMMFHAAQMLKTSPNELDIKLEQHMNEMKGLRRMVETLKAREAAGEASRFLMAAKKIGELKVVTTTVPEADPAQLRQMGDTIREKDANVVAVLACINDGKITLLAVCGKEAVSKGVKAGDIIKSIAPICGGKGGGKPDSAMGGGSEVLKLDDALAAVDNVVAETLGL